MDTNGKGKNRKISVSPSPSMRTEASYQSFSMPSTSNGIRWNNERRPPSPSFSQSSAYHELEEQRRHRRAPLPAPRSEGTVPRNFYCQPSSDDSTANVCSDDHGHDSDDSTSTDRPSKKVS